MTAMTTEDAARRLLAFLDDPHPGLFTWHDAVGSAKRDLLDALLAEVPPKHLATVLARHPAARPTAPEPPRIA